MTDTAQHILGPLQVVWIDGEEDCLPHLSICDHDGDEAATIVNRTGTPTTYQLANAHLFASAPDLLAERDRLCEQNAVLLAALEECEFAFDRAPWSSAIAVAREAIALAKAGA